MDKMIRRYSPIIYYFRDESRSYFRDNRTPVYETKKHGLSGVTEKVHNLITTRGDKAERLAEINRALERAVLDPGHEGGIDLAALEKQPYFEMRGFEGHPPDVYRPGEEPAFAPMSKEQMRLLLIGTLPTEMLPFVLENFVFEYEPTEPGEEDDGPKAKVSERDGKKKVTITFNHHHFYTKGLPPDSDLNIVQKAIPLARPQQLRQVSGFMDPSKVAFLIGNVISLGLIDQRKDDDMAMLEKIFTGRSLLTIVKDRLAGKGKTDQAKEKHDFLVRQWQSFAALALVAPDVARRENPEAYTYYVERVRQFDRADFDEAALTNLNVAAFNQDGTIRVENAKLRDLRSEEEKLADKGIDPDLAWYERFIKGVNRTTYFLGNIPILSKIIPYAGQRITYKNPQIGNILEDADKQAKELLATGINEAMRDEELGSILSKEGNDFNEKDRKEAFGYLLASSQAGEFSEWRIHAYLYKFSKTYRKWKGLYLGENDYKELQLLHSESEKAGRLGTGKLPYEAVPLRTRDAQFVGKRAFLYVRKDRAKYLKEVEKALSNKSNRALTDANDKAFDQFTSASGGYYDSLDEKFNPDPAGMMTQSGNLEDYLGKKMGPEMAQWLSDIGVGKISPDARALAIAYYANYRERGMETDKYVSKKARDVISHYEEQLNTPATDRIKEILAEDPKALARSYDFARINEQLLQTDTAKQTIMQTLGADIGSARFGLMDPIGPKVVDYLASGVTDPKQLLGKMRPLLAQLYQDNPENIRIAENQIMRFMFDNKTIQNLILLDKIEKYQKEIEPAHTVEIENAAKQLTLYENDPDELFKMGLDESMTHAQLEALKEQGLKLSREQIEQIKNANKSDVVEQAAQTAAGDGQQPQEAAPQVNMDEAEDSPAKCKTRAEIVARILASGDTDELLKKRITAKMVEQSINYLEDTIINYDPSPARKAVADFREKHQGMDETDIQKAIKENKIAPKSTLERVVDWANSPTIFKLPALQNGKGTILLEAAQASSENATTQAEGLRNLMETIAAYRKAVKFEESSVAAKQEAKKKPRKNDDE